MGDSPKPEFEEPPTRPNKAQCAGRRTTVKVGKIIVVDRSNAMRPKVDFTGLLLALAACVAERNQEVVHETLQKTRTSDGIAWIKTKLGATVR